MTWLPLAFSLLMVALVAVPMLMLPLLARPSIPLGVNVPAGYEDDPSIAHARTRYLQLAGLTIVVSIIAAILLLAWPVAGLLVPTFLCLFGMMASYVWARRGIIRAKAAGAWYADKNVRVRVAAALTPDAGTRPATQWAWYAASIMLVIIGFVAGGIRYPELPDPMPVHWGISGVADRFEAKSIGSVFMPMFVALGLVVMIALIARFMPLTQPRQSAAGTSRAGQSFDQARITIGILGATTLAISAMMTGMSVATWFQPESALINAVTITGIGLIAVVLVIGTWLYVQAGRRPSAQVEAGVTATAFHTRSDVASSTPTTPSSPGPTRTAPRDSGAEAPPSNPDDDSYWKAGLVYVNKNNPALWVPKRVGIGWTINMGRPMSWVILGALILFIVASAVLPSVLGA